MGAAQGQMPGREEGRRSSEDNQEQDKTSKQLALSASSGCNEEGTPAKSLGLDLPGILGALVKVEEQGSQVQQRVSGKDFYQIPQADVPWMRKEMLHWGTCEGEKVEVTFGKKEKEKRNSQGEGGPKDL